MIDTRRCENREPGQPREASLSQDRKGPLRAGGQRLGRGGGGRGRAPASPGLAGRMRGPPGEAGGPDGERKGRRASLPERGGGGRGGGGAARRRATESLSPAKARTAEPAGSLSEGSPPEWMMRSAGAGVGVGSVVGAGAAAGTAAGAGSGPASPAGSGGGPGSGQARRSWLPPAMMPIVRGVSQARSRECREWFGLPESEELLEEYSCALLKKILLQGRMYVFREHICFYSKVFTFVTKRTIELRTVTSINRAKNMGFPNSIEVIGGGKRYFFTSFLFREDSFRQMVTSWSQCSPYARLFMGDGSDISRGEPAALRSSGPPRGGRLTPERAPLDTIAPLSLSAPPCPTEVTAIASDSAPAASAATSAVDASILTPEAGQSASERLSLGSAMSLPVLGEREATALLDRRTGQSLRSHARTHSSPEELVAMQAAKVPHGGAGDSPDMHRSAPSHHQKHASLDSIGSHNVSGDGFSGSVSDEFTGSDAEHGLRAEEVDEEDEGEEEEEERLHEPFSGEEDDANNLGIYASPPPLPEGSTVLLERDFPLAPLEFHRMFLSDESHFLVRVHEDLGDFNITCTEWKSHSFLGHARDFAFHKKLIAFSALGASSRVSCHQTQRVGLYRVGGVEHLVFESSQVNSDVPFGDSFVVRERWDVTRRVGDSGPSRLKHSVAVPFSKPTLLRSTIEKNTIALCRKSSEHFIKFACSEISRGSAKEPGELPQQNALAIDAEKIPLEWRDQIVQMLSLNSRQPAPGSPKLREGPSSPTMSDSPGTLSLPAARLLAPVFSGLMLALQGLSLLPWKLQVATWQGVQFLWRVTRRSLEVAARLDLIRAGIVAVVGVQLYLFLRMNSPAHPEPYIGLAAGATNPQQRARLDEHILFLQRELRAARQVANGLQSELELVEALRRRLYGGLQDAIQ